MNKINRIKEIISKNAYGIKTEKGIRPSATKSSLKKGFKRPITNNLIKEHEEYEKTIYFFGNEENNETLVMIDIDVDKKQKKGSSSGAVEFAKHINQNIIPIYFEPSTNGKGIHGYFVLNKSGYSAKKVNQILKRFENYLQKEAIEKKSDIEIVEIKGTLFEIEYKNKKISEVKYGMLGKIPRKIEELLKINTLINIKVLEKSFNIDKKNYNKKGSISEKHISEIELLNIKYYEKIGEEILSKKIIKANKFLITKEDFGIMLMILKFFKKNKNKDNTTPTKRAMNLWKALYKANEIKRGWNHHRWKEMRNILSKEGMIKWIDNRYQIGNKTSRTEGISCKWEISEKMYMYLAKSEKSKQASFVDTKPLLVGVKVSNLIKLEEIMYEFTHKVPILSLISKENIDYIYNKAYSCINNFCTA